MLSYAVKTRSLSKLGLNRYRVVTDRRTDRITIANTRSAVPVGPAVARKKLSQRTPRDVIMFTTLLPGDITHAGDE